MEARMSHGDLSVVHGTGSARSRLALLAGLFVTLLAMVLAVPGTASAVDAAGNRPMTHPELDWMGSTVRAHEGGGSSAKPIEVTPLVTQTPGMDVSSWQGNVNWSGAWANGAKFAYIKATEGTSYTNAYFAQQYNGSYNVGMIRGSYHFALPNVSSGATQADYFIAHGGGWSADGRTLPGALDIEYNPYGATCYGLGASSMVNWIASFSNQYHYRTGRYPTIYSTTDWWTSCTGNSSAFGATNALWIARYSTSVGTLPAGWGWHTIWQYSDSGVFPGDQNYFNGALDRVQAYAAG
jgi:GH25 family lysozyme M1 (1,4-beta-N-acetylmuramidase)